MSIKAYIIPIFLGLTTFFLTKDQFFKIYSRPSFEYCEHEGMYYKDVGQMYGAIKNSKIPIPFRGYEYAYPCFIKNLHIENLKDLGGVVFYAVTYGEVGSIPSTISQISTLERLQIQDQELISIPPEIGDLEKLRILNLGGNKIEKLPESIEKLQSLESLLLFDNSLASLPREIGTLQNLRVLDLRANFLSSLPHEISRLTNLEYLYLGDNKISADKKSEIERLLPNTKIFF